MRLRHANSGLIWIQNWLWFIMNIWCKSDPFSAWGFKILICLFHYPGSCLPPPLFTGGCPITIPRPPLLLSTSRIGIKKWPLYIYIYIYIYMTTLQYIYIYIYTYTYTHTYTYTSHTLHIVEQRAPHHRRRQACRILNQVGTTARRRACAGVTQAAGKATLKPDAYHMMAICEVTRASKMYTACTSPHAHTSRLLTFMRNYWCEGCWDLAWLDINNGWYRIFI